MKAIVKRFKQIPATIAIPVIICVILAGMQACTNPLEVGNDFLEKPPSVDVTKDSIFTDADKAKNFLFHAYRSLPYGPGSVAGPYDTNELYRAPLASLTDMNQSMSNSSGANTYYYTGSYSSTFADNQATYMKFNYYNSGAWKGIRQAYIFINNVDKVPNMDDATKKRLKAEARMIIAIQYTELFRNYGGVPWLTHAISPNEELDIKRATAKATLDSTLKMINKAIPDLPFSLDNPSTESGRLTQAGAMGLKVRLLLFAASPLFNSSQPYMQGKAADKKLVWFGGKDPQLWQRTADAAKKLIDKINQTGAYHLADTGNPKQDFKHAYFDRDSPEILISTRKRYKAYFFPPNARDRGVFLPTDNYVKMFPMASGKRISDPTSSYDPQHPYDNRDPRLYETVLLTGEPYQGRTAEMWIGGRERKNKNGKIAGTGYQARKFLLDISTSRNSPVQFPYLRLPEIYYSYAEALNHINGGPTTEACSYVKKVRDRVDLGGLPGCINMSQKEFRRAIMRERARELGYEEVRWYDLIRWKRDDVFKKTLYGMDQCKQGASPQDACDGSYGSNTYIYDQFKLNQRAWKDNFSPKWYLSAFPRTEVLKGYLTQNPGW